MKKGILDLILIILALTYFLGVHFYSDEWRDQILFPERGETVEIIVTSGSSAAAIAESFKDASIVTSSRRLSFWFRQYNIDRKIQPGKYYVRKGSPWEVAQQMVDAKPDRQKMTIIPGTDISDIERQESVIDLGNSLMMESNFPPEMKRFLPATIRSRASMLIPDTYYLDSKDPALLVKASAEKWWTDVGRVIVEKGKTMNLKDLAVIASLVEKEAIYDKERRIISGVIYNRLNNDMMLQIDASVIYAWKQEGTDLKRVLYKHLEIDSPYNTYKQRGLPPEPICIPSYESWIAAIEPDAHTYLYYVADTDGTHLFSETYNEHKKAIRKARDKTN